PVTTAAFTPKPGVVTLQLLPLATERGPAGEVVRYHIRPKLGLFASPLVTDVPDTCVWILQGEAPAFLKAEGPLYFMGPIWRVEPPYARVRRTRGLPKDAPTPNSDSR